MCNKGKWSPLKWRVYWSRSSRERSLTLLIFQIKEKKKTRNNRTAAVIKCFHLLDEKTMVHCGRCSPTWKWFLRKNSSMRHLKIVPKRPLSNTSELICLALLQEKERKKKNQRSFWKRMWYGTISWGSLGLRVVCWNQGPKSHLAPKEPGLTWPVLSLC